MQQHILTISHHDMRFLVTEHDKRFLGQEHVRAIQPDSLFFPTLHLQRNSLPLSFQSATFFPRASLFLKTWGLGRWSCTQKDWKRWKKRQRHSNMGPIPSVYHKHIFKWFGFCIFKCLNGWAGL
jgi:hypothetical protein